MHAGCIVQPPTPNHGNPYPREVALGDTLGVVTKVQTGAARRAKILFSI